MVPRRLAVLLLATTLVVGVACSGESDAGTTPRTPSTTDAPASGAGTSAPAAPARAKGAFSVDCAISHRSADDPIVYPGQPGAGHSHEFFGATTTDHASTAASLRAGPTSCSDPDDTAAYWAPTLLRAGRPVTPLTLRAYYGAAPGMDPEALSAPPAGLRVVAGNQVDHGQVGNDHAGRASSGEGSSSHAGWSCGLRRGHLTIEPPAGCTAWAPLTMVVAFPDCWDGRNLDSADHRSHLAYSVGGRCPAGHPEPLVQLVLAVEYPFGGDVADLSLSSGPPSTAHADFVNAWDQEALERQVALCVHADVACTAA